MTSYEKAEAFRWLMHHSNNRIKALGAEERVEDAEEQYEKDCETYDKVKEALEDEKDVEELDNNQNQEVPVKKALIVVDAQNDFMPGGNLAVPEGDQIVPVINELQEDFDTIIFTQDYHPANHCSFKENGGPWPVHCVEGTEGSEINKDIITGNGGDKKVKFILKGTNTDVDSYSAFWDNNKAQETELNKYLKENSITDVYVVGLALNFCVMYTAVDAVEAGYSTHLIKKGCRGIEVEAGAIEKAIKEMEEKGVIVE